MAAAAAAAEAAVARAIGVCGSERASRGYRISPRKNI
jgi:hypothetical protein